MAEQTPRRTGDGYPRKRARTRRALLQAGMAVFAEQGPTGATVGAVAARAGVAAGTFYNHFPSMTDLLAAVTDELARGVEIASETLELVEHDAAVRVVIGTRQLLALAHEDPVAARSFVSLLATVPAHRARIRTIVRGAVSDGIDQGRFGRRDAGAATDAVLGAVVQWMRSLLAGEVVATEECLEIALAIVGVAPAEAGEAIEAARSSIAVTT